MDIFRKTRYALPLFTGIFIACSTRTYAADTSFFDIFTSSCSGTQLNGSLKAAGTVHNTSITEEPEEAPSYDYLLDTDGYDNAGYDPDFNLYPATEDEYNLLARCIMSEAGNQPYECKLAVAESVINRTINSDKYPDTITGVITQGSQYSTANNGAPTEECYQAASEALDHQSFDKQIMYFRTGHYHDFATDYVKLGNTYFSTE